MPFGNFDFIELSYKVISTEAYQYYTNNFTRSFCKIDEDLNVFSVINFSDTIGKNIINVNLTNLCPMSYYNITEITFKDGFNSEGSDKIIKTSIC